MVSKMLFGKSGSRLRTTLDFGHVTLNLNEARASDSGIYTCKAINLLGEAVSTTSIKVEGKLQHFWHFLK